MSIIAVHNCICQPHLVILQPVPAPAFKTVLSQQQGLCPGHTAAKLLLYCSFQYRQPTAAFNCMAQTAMHWTLVASDQVTHNSGVDVHMSGYSGSRQATAKTAASLGWTCSSPSAADILLTCDCHCCRLLLGIMRYHYDLPSAHAAGLLREAARRQHWQEGEEVWYALTLTAVILHTAQDINNHFCMSTMTWAIFSMRGQHCSVLRECKVLSRQQGCSHLLSDTGTRPSCCC